jgi:DNA-directed RNA polymerase specialized sigma subunit
MLLAVGNKILNRSEFRNYPKELKEDMLSMGLYKLIRGLKNYNFAFNNPFSYCTQTFWNAYLTIITKHYRQLNIKKDLMAKLA